MFQLHISTTVYFFIPCDPHERLLVGRQSFEDIGQVFEKHCVKSCQHAVNYGVISYNKCQYSANR